jgi:hypothetical protein
MKPPFTTDAYNRNGIYQMKGIDCPLKYVNHTGRIFKMRCKEHVQAIRNSSDNCGYSNT